MLRSLSRFVRSEVADCSRLAARCRRAETDLQVVTSCDCKRRRWIDARAMTATNSSSGMSPLSGVESGGDFSNRKAISEQQLVTTITAPSRITSAGFGVNRRCLDKAAFSRCVVHQRNQQGANPRLESKDLLKSCPGFFPKRDAPAERPP